MWCMQFMCQLCMLGLCSVYDITLVSLSLTSACTATCLWRPCLSVWTKVNFVPLRWTCMGCMLKKRCVCWRTTCWPLVASTIQEAHCCRSAANHASFHIGLHAQHDLSLHGSVKSTGNCGFCHSLDFHQSLHRVQVPQDLCLKGARCDRQIMTRHCWLCR